MVAPLIPLARKKKSPDLMGLENTLNRLSQTPTRDVPVLPQPSFAGAKIEADPNLQSPVTRTAAQSPAPSPLARAGAAIAPLASLARQAVPQVGRALMAGQSGALTPAGVAPRVMPPNPVQQDMQTPAAQAQVQGVVQQDNARAAAQPMGRYEQSLNASLGRAVPATRVAPADLQAAGELGLSRNYDYSGIGVPKVAPAPTDAQMPRMNPLDAARQAGLTVTPTPTVDGGTRQVMSGGTDLSPSSDLYRQQMAKQSDVNFQSALTRANRESQLQAAQPAPTPARLAYAGNAQSGTGVPFVQRVREAEAINLAKTRPQVDPLVQERILTEQVKRMQLEQAPQREAETAKQQKAREDRQARIDGAAAILKSFGDMPPTPEDPSFVIYDAALKALQGEITPPAAGGGVPPMGGGGFVPPPGAARGRDNVTGATVYRLPDGSVVDENGNPIAN